MMIRYAVILDLLLVFSCSKQAATTEPSSSEVVVAPKSDDDQKSRVDAAAIADAPQEQGGETQRDTGAGTPQSETDLALMAGFVEEFCACSDESCFNEVEQRAKTRLSEEQVGVLAESEPAALGKLMGQMMGCIDAFNSSQP